MPASRAASTRRRHDVDAEHVDTGCDEVRGHRATHVAEAEEGDGGHRGLHSVVVECGALLLIERREGAQHRVRIDVGEASTGSTAASGPCR